MICLNDVSSYEVLAKHDQDKCIANYHNKCFYRLLKTTKEVGCPNCFKDIETDKLVEIEKMLEKEMKGVDMTLKGGKKKEE